MGIRNFWVEGNIDGRRTTISGGPQGKDGGIKLVIKVREQGGISKHEMHVEGKVVGPSLQLFAWIETDGQPVTKDLVIETQR